MENLNQNPSDLQRQLIYESLKNSILGISLAQSLQEEIVAFISSSTNEPKDLILKRIDERRRIIKANILESLSESIGILDEIDFHDKKNAE